MKIAALLILSLFLFVSEALGDGRDIAATSSCSVRETDDAVSLLGRGSGWSDDRWAAAQKLLGCYGGKFQLQKFITKSDGSSSSAVTYRIETLKANLTYEYEVFVRLSVDEDGITKSGSGQPTAK